MEMKKEEAFMRPAFVAPAVAGLATMALSACVSTGYTIRRAELPDNLDAFLSSRENAVPGIIDGDQKEITWAGERGRKTPLSIVYIHGWQGSPRDYQAVLGPVAKELGANIFFTRLKGHCVNTEEILTVTLDDWINDVWEAMEIGSRIGERVVVAGTSMGGDLTLWLAAQKPRNLAGVVLFSCAVQPRDRRSEQLLWPWPFRNLIVRMALGKYNSMAFRGDLYPTGNPELFARYNPTRYRSESTLKLMAAVKLVRQVPIESIAVPSLWLYSEDDEAVDIPTLKSFFARMGGAGKRLVPVTGAHAHMLGGDMFQPETTPTLIGDITSFLRETGIAPVSAGG
jgi:esterase/lipase